MPVDLKQIVEALPDGIVVLGSTGQVVEINSEACRILECSAESILGRGLNEVLDSDHPVLLQVGKAVKDGEPVIAHEIDFEARDHRFRSADVAVSTLHGETADGRGALVTLRDRTVSRQFHKIASERDRLEAFGHIAAGIAHEVKNPLGGIRGAAELLATWSSESRSEQAAELIVGEVDRILALVDELMVFARGDHLDAETMNIHRVLDTVLDLLSVDTIASSVDIRRNYDPSIPEFAGDSDRLKQVFLNLGRNALQAMSGPGNRLSVTTRMNLGRRIRGPDGRAISAIDVEFSDTGPGIDSEILEQLSTPLFTTRADGHGLGLAVARHWLMRHGGTLELRSKPGSGTTAIATLPLRQYETRTAGPAGEKPE